MPCPRLARSRRSVVAVAAIWIATWACASPESPTNPLAGERSKAVGDSAVHSRYDAGTPDDDMATIAARAPGFAGMFWDSTGQLVITTTADASPSAVVAAVGDPDIARRFHGVRDAVVEGRIRLTEDAQFDFASLMRWRDSLRHTLSQGGVNYYSIDEAHNSIRIGSRTAGAEDRIRNAALQLSVPASALAFERGSAPRPEHLLRWDGGVRMRPLAAA